MKRRTALIFLLLGVIHASIGLAQGQTRKGGDPELPKLEERVKALERDFALQAQGNTLRMDAQDKRLGDFSTLAGLQSTHTTWVGNLVAMFGAGITILVFVAGLVVYITSKKRAEDEARVTAEDWFRKRTGELEREIAGLRDKAMKASEEIKGHISRVGVDAEKARRSINESAGAILDSHRLASRGADPAPNVPPQARAAVEEISAALKDRPESSFSSEDHFARGLDQFASGNYQSALSSFEESLRLAERASSPAPDLDIARLLVAKGATLGALGKPGQEIEVYDELDRRFGQDDSPALREQVARGLVGKSAALGDMAGKEEAIAVYDELDRRFGKDESPAVREQVAVGLRNKAITLGTQGSYVEALAVCEELHRRFGNDDSPAVREPVATGANTAGLCRMMLAKASWKDELARKQLLETALSNLRLAQTMYGPAAPPSVHGNLSYCLFLLGDRDAASPIVRESLRVGGQELLDAQREDALRYRVEPEDSDYEHLLNALWKELTS